MDINDNLRGQIEAILAAKSVQQMPMERLIKRKLSPELAELVIKSGRLAPCGRLGIRSSPHRGIRAFCSKRHNLDCLKCPDYKTTEVPGEMGEGIAQFENGQVIHMVKSIESDGYYRSGITLCGREIDEGSTLVEIYPDIYINDIPQEAICKQCAANAKFKST